MRPSRLAIFPALKIEIKSGAGEAGHAVMGGLHGETPAANMRNGGAMQQAKIDWYASKTSPAMSNATPPIT
jgi:hypothetical protein